MSDILADISTDIPWWAAALLIPLAGWIGALVNETMRARRALAEREFAAQQEADAEIRKTFLDLIRRFEGLLDSYLRTLVAFEFEFQEFRREQEQLIHSTRQIESEQRTMAESIRRIEQAIGLRFDKHSKLFRDETEEKEKEQNV